MNSCCAPHLRNMGHGNSTASSRFNLSTFPQVSGEFICSSPSGVRHLTGHAWYAIMPTRGKLKEAPHSPDSLSCGAKKPPRKALIPASCFQPLTDHIDCVYKD